MKMIKLKSVFNEKNLTNSETSSSNDNLPKENNFNFLSLVKTTKKEDWTDIHSDFASNLSYSLIDKTYQQLWEENGFTYQDAKEWIQVCCFPQHCDFVIYLRKQSYSSKIAFQDKSQAHCWLGWKYPSEERKEITKLDISKQKLNGSLNFQSFVNLKKLDVRDNNLEIRLESLPESLEKLYCDGQLAEKLEDYEKEDSDDDFNIPQESILPMQIIDINKIISRKHYYYDYQSWKKDYELKKKLDLSSKEELIEKLLVASKEISNLEELLIKLKQSRTLSVVSSLDLEKIQLKKIQREQDWETASMKSVISSVASDLELEFIEKDIKNLERLEKKQEKIEKLKKDNEELLSQKSLFEEQEKEIEYLEERVKDLINLIKQQKNKIISTFLRILPEKELVQDLILTHLEFTRFKRQGFGLFDYSKKCREYKKKCLGIEELLTDKIGEENMDEIQCILTDCEELVSQELELETKLNNKTHLIEEQEQILQIANVDSKKKEIAELGGRLILGKEKIKDHIKINKSQFRQLKEEKKFQLEMEITKTQEKTREETSYLQEKWIIPSLSITVSPIFNNSSQSNQEENNISVQQGNAIFGNQIGDNVDFSQNKAINYKATKGGFLNTGQIEMAGESNSIIMGSMQAPQAQIIQQPTKSN